MSKRNDAIAELRNALTEGIYTHLVTAYGDEFAAGITAEIRCAVEAVTGEWDVYSKYTPTGDGHPLAEGGGHCGNSFGHYVVAALPWVSETDDETSAREARLAAHLWGAEDGPPLPGVRMTQLLRQSAWWRYRVDGRLIPVRIEHMTHEHRLGVLGWLRDHAHGLHASAGLELFDAPDDVIRFHDAQPPSEWLEEHELAQALAYWTTPYGESPLTWRPMHEAPWDRPVIVRDTADGTEAWARVFYSEWCLLGEVGEPLNPPEWFHTPGVQWREPREDEQPPGYIEPVCDCERGETCPRCQATPWCDCEDGEPCEHAP